MTEPRPVFLCLCRRLAIGGICVFELFVHASVRDHILKVCEHDILQTACGNFTKFYNFGAVGYKDKLVLRF